MKLRYKVQDGFRYKVKDGYGDTLSYEGSSGADVDIFVTGDTVTSKSDLDDEYGRRDAAQECAEHFWNEHDGETHGWPLTFIILGEGGEELGRFSVDVETAPRFSASAA